MKFQEFQKEVTDAGLTAKDCGNGHWQICGGKYSVNFYPHARKGPTFYVNATNTGVRRKVTVADAIKAATNPMHKRPLRKTKRKRTKFYTRIKKKLLEDDPRCYWCKKPLTAETATNDHMIPLSKGGTNGIDNQVLACYNCNQNRRDSLPSRTEWEQRKEPSRETNSRPQEHR